MQDGNVDPAVLGLADVANICTPDLDGQPLAVSAVELASFLSDITCAHELGHRLVKILLWVKC